ncbi:hypothetical protein KDM41_05440, partial [bacterium]|nr:hypothetical protein [bacterium]
MLPTIKSRLIAAFGAIVALLALTTLVADRQITATTRTTEELVGPYWSTADHLMEASIRIREHSRTVLNPGFELDRKAFERTYEDELQELAAGFGETALPPATVAEIRAGLERLRTTYRVPLETATLPGERMEVADA